MRQAKKVMADRRAYLDWNASAPLLPAARATMLDAMDGANPSSVHAEGRAARQAVERARRQVAALVGVRDAEVVFTSGATEAASTLLTPHWTRASEPLFFSRVYVCAADHPATLRGGRFAPEQISLLPVDADGLIRLDALREALARHDAAEGAALVAVHAANNETGVVQPWAEVGALARAHGAVLVLDAVQAAGRLPLSDMLDQADAVILSSHKIGGPQGAGAFVVRPGAPMPRALVTGGGQERGFRAGTENAAAIAGFGAAAQAAGERLERAEAVAAMRDHFEVSLLRLVPDVVIHGAGAPRLPNTSFFSIPALKAETAQMAFDLAGVALSAGSACSSGKVGPSHVLKAMGVEAAEGALRISIGPETDEPELALFEGALERLVRRRAMPAAKAA